MRTYLTSMKAMTHRTLVNHLDLASSFDILVLKRTEKEMQMGSQNATMKRGKITHSSKSPIRFAEFKNILQYCRMDHTTVSLPKCYNCSTQFP